MRCGHVAGVFPLLEEEQTLLTWRGTICPLRTHSCTLSWSSRWETLSPRMPAAGDQLLGVGR